MSPHPSPPTTERAAALIRGWVETVARAAGPKPMALPYLAAGDPVALARITLRTIHEAIREDRRGLARLALIVGATAEHETAGGRRGTGWGTEAHVRMGLALIDCAMRATGWFSLASVPDDSPRNRPGLATRLFLVVEPGAMDAARHRLGLEVPQAEGYRPAVREMAAPHRAIRTLMGGRSVSIALTEAADVGDLLGGGRAGWGLSANLRSTGSSIMPQN